MLKLKFFLIDMRMICTERYHCKITECSLQLSLQPWQERTLPSKSSVNSHVGVIVISIQMKQRARGYVVLLRWAI